MSHLSILGTSKVVIPYIKNTSGSPTVTSALAASGNAIQFIGDIYLQNPLGGSKTISAAGGGSIIWRTGSSTFANGSSVFTVGLQDISTTTSPAQGDGVFDVKAVHTGSGITSAAINTSVMTSGSKTISHGTSIAIVLEFTTVAGADSVAVTYASTGSEVYASNMGNVVVDNLTGGVFAIPTTNGVPLAIIKFDDGSVGYITSSNFNAGASNINININSATANEYGNVITIPTTFYAMGIFSILNHTTGNAGDFELLLYSSPLTSAPAVERTITIDATQAGVSNLVRSTTRLFSTPFLMKANTPYAITARPTTSNNINLYYDDGITDSMPLQPPNNYAYAIRRLGNTGIFSDTNGGTAKTRLYRIAVFGFYMEQGVNNATYQIGF